MISKAEFVLEYAPGSGLAIIRSPCSPGSNMVLNYFPLFAIKRLGLLQT
jgi:hypothetical protein